MNSVMFETALIVVIAACVIYISSFFTTKPETAFVVRLVIAIIAVVMVLRAWGVWHL